MWNGTAWYALTAEVPDGSITGPKMADNSSAVFYTEGSSNITGEFIGQLAIDDAEGQAYAWDGTAWISLTSADAYTGGTGDIVDITIDNSTREITASLQDTAGPAEFLAGPTDDAGTVTYREIDNSDLPLADFGLPGAVEPGFGLDIFDGVIDLPIMGNGSFFEYRLVSYNEYGIITGSAADEVIVIPPATTNDLGGVIVGEGLTVTADGLLSVDFDSNTTLPIATESTLGAVIIGGGIAVSESGVISVSYTHLTLPTICSV